MSGLFAIFGLMLIPVVIMAFIVLLVILLTNPENKRLRRLIALLAVGFFVNMASLFVIGLIELLAFGKGPFGIVENSILITVQYFSAGYLVGVFLRFVGINKPVMVLIPIITSWLPMFVVINTGNYDQVLLGMLINTAGGILGVSCGVAQKPA